MITTTTAGKRKILALADARSRGSKQEEQVKKGKQMKRSMAEFAVLEEK